MQEQKPHSPADPDFSPEVVADLYRYRPVQLWLTQLLGVFFGVLGAHRFYCGRSFSGLFMLLTGGGAVAWWIWDLFHLRQMVEASNAEQRQRFEAGLPPRELSFLPPQNELDLRSPPKWSNKRSGRGRVLGSAVFLAVIGFTLGKVSASTGTYEPVIILALFIFGSLIAARWKDLAHIPVLNILTRWAHRLRLYYHTVDPGNIWLLTLRPLFGLLLAPWRPKARAEVRLYLQLGVFFALVFATQDLIEVLNSGGLWAGFGLLLAEFIQTLIFTYLFVAPAGALLTTQLLLTRRDHLVWALSALTLGSMYLGMS